MICSVSRHATEAAHKLNTIPNNPGSVLHAARSWLHIVGPSAAARTRHSRPPHRFHPLPLRPRHRQQPQAPGSHGERPSSANALCRRKKQLRWRHRMKDMFQQECYIHAEIPTQRFRTCQTGGNDLMFKPCQVHLTLNTLSVADMKKYQSCGRCNNYSVSNWRIRNPRMQDSLAGSIRSTLHLSRLRGTLMKQGPPGSWLIFSRPQTLKLLLSRDIDSLNSLNNLFLDIPTPSKGCFLFAFTVLPRPPASGPHRPKKPCQGRRVAASRRRWETGLEAENHPESRKDLGEPNKDLS